MTVSERARPVKLLLMDVDGTLTDGTLLVMPDGEEVKSYHVRDGLGILLARMGGLGLGIITGKTSRSLEKRAERLKIIEIHQGVLDKGSALADIMKRTGLPAREIAYIGDDLGDLSVLRRVGLAGCVADAAAEVKEACHYVCAAKGGAGAVREFIEFILEAQGKWANLKERAHEIRNFDI